MKIGFVGLKGFTKETNLIDINDLTFLIGKNSSGKSSFVKLYKLFFNSFKNIQKIQDLIGIEIDIAIDDFGGKDNVQNLFDETNPRIIFTSQFEFYRGLHEIHIILEVTDYLIKVIEIEIYNKDDNQKKKLFVTYDDSAINCDIFELRKVYLKNIKTYNLCENYLYAKSDNPELLKQLKEEYGEKSLELLIKNHIGPYGYESILYLTPDASETESKLNHPFYSIKRIESYNAQIEFINFADEIPKFELTQNQAIELLNKPKNEDGLEMFNHYCYTENLNFDDIKFVQTIYEDILKNYSPGRINYSYTIDSRFFKFIKKLQDDNLFKKYFNQSDNEQISLDLSSIYSKHFEILIEITDKIIQSSIVGLIKNLGDINYLSNVRYQPTRSFNIFNQTNSFSTFIKNWKIIDDRTKSYRQSFLKNFLLEFEIADDINIIIEDNVGFIRLLKSKNTFAIIDEGSGISNIISIALFLTEALEFEYETSNLSYYKNNTWFKDEDLNALKNHHGKIFIIEEPESNLHPSLQSKLANLFVEIHKKTNVKILIETHSEYLIRKIQFLVAKNDIDANKISINYFTLKSAKNKQKIETKEIKINEKGILSEEFGPGFLDEANNLAVSLFILNQSQSN